MKVLPSEVFPHDVRLYVPDVFLDWRGYFKETYSTRNLPDLPPFVQDNLSFSRNRVLRGMHLSPHMGKLVSVVQGKIFDVVVDMRETSPTYLKWESFDLMARSHKQLWVPPGFAHGFVVQSRTAMVSYKQTALYDPATEKTIRWDDPKVGILWPGIPKLSLYWPVGVSSGPRGSHYYALSSKDLNAPLL